MTPEDAHEFYSDPANREVAGPGRKRKAPRLTSMTAVRFDPQVIEAARKIAQQEGMTVSSWIRRLVGHEVAEPRPSMLVEVPGLAAPLRFPDEAIRAIAGAAMPALWSGRAVTLTIAPGDTRINGPFMAISSPVTVDVADPDSAQRPTGLIPGSGRKGEPRALPSSLGPVSGYGRTFACQHMSIGNVVSAECAICGPLRAAV